MKESWLEVNLRITSHESALALKGDESVLSPEYRWCDGLGRSGLQHLQIPLLIKVSRARLSL